MAITTVDGIINAISAGQSYKFVYNKQTQNSGAAYTVARWYDLAMWPGTPQADTFPSLNGALTAVSCIGNSASVLTNTAANWTVAVATNVVTVDTISAHGYAANQVVTTNPSTSAWTVNTFMRGITFTIASITSSHAFTFALTQGNQGATTETATPSSMTSGIGLTNTGGNWTVAVSGSNVVTVDTISAHNFVAGQVVTTNSGAGAWTTNTFMQTLSFTITSTPTTHTFTFAKTQAGQVATAEGGVSSGLAPTPPMYGNMPTGGPVNAAGYTKYLTGIEVSTGISTGVPCWLMLVDMLMYYPAISLNTTGAQSLLGSATLPRYTNGNGVQMFLELATGTGPSSASTLTLSYYNSASPAVQHSVPATPALVNSTIATHIISSGTAINNFGPFLPLAAGDTGVTTATGTNNFQVSVSGSTTTANLILCRPIAQIPLTTQYLASSRDLVFNMPSMPVINDGACLSFLLFAGGAVANLTNFQATLDFVWG